MAVLTWDGSGERFYETGVDHGILFPVNAATGTYGAGVAWNGLTSVSDNPEGGDRTELWADNIMYATMNARETAGGSISCYTYPDEFAGCMGMVSPKAGMHIGQQARKSFGFAYRSKVGNDLTDNVGYILHVYYGCTASPSSRDYSTINDNPDAIEFSFDFEATPVPYDTAGTYEPTAYLEFDSRTLSTASYTAIENALIGTASEPSKLPTPSEFAALITTN